VAKRVRAAVVQASPVVLDADETLHKVENLLARAAKEGARIAAFPETFVPVYPLWCDAGAFGRWGEEAAKEIHARLLANSLLVPSEATERIGRAARDHELVVSISVNERDAAGRTLWNALLTFDADGALVGHHRKLVPTHGERLVWAPGDASGLRAVETAAGKVGGLLCWEHWMPAARQVLHDDGEEIHVAAWPHLREMYFLASRHYAFEGRAFVLAAGMVLTVSDLERAGVPVGKLWHGEDLRDPMLVGGSAIFGPDGSVLAGPAPAKETILVADLDLDAVRKESLALDTAGHYSRPDLFRLEVRRERRGRVSSG
jgi:predicted amidohydrolase